MLKDAFDRSVEAVLHEMQTVLEHGEIPQRIYGDPEIFRLELERIFARCWIFVGHESEIPNPGDYVARPIADNPMIVTRDAHGAIHVLLDSCRHRGVKLCRGSKGNALQFACPYHGWTYRSDGALIGVPSRAEGYADTLRTEDWGLLRARVALYQGLIFACLDDDSPSLEEYLGDFRWYMDVHFGLAPEGLEVVGAPLRWVLAGNWKSASENIAGDSYHTQTLHRSIALSGLIPLRATGPWNAHLIECGGHASSIGRVAPGEASFWGNGADYERFYRGSTLTPAQLEFARRSYSGQLCVFPNFGCGHVGPSTEDATREPAGQFFVWALQPKSPTAFEVWKWILVPKAISAEQKQRSYEVTVANHGPAGIVDQDDTSVFHGIATAGASTVVRLRNAKLNYAMGRPGASIAKVIDDWPGPGTAIDSRLEDGVMKTVLRNWLAWMTK